MAVLEMENLQMEVPLEKILRPFVIALADPGRGGGVSFELEFPEVMRTFLGRLRAARR
ncbi:MAG TPA: hypothetical protein VKF62_03560 [Planctomycetota bacterium]|nr:hypothetical protein [Planctomycetota bacterium]